MLMVRMESTLTYEGTRVVELQWVEDILSITVGSRSLTLGDQQRVRGLVLMT